MHVHAKFIRVHVKFMHEYLKYQYQNTNPSVIATDNFGWPGGGGGVTKDPVVQYVQDSQ